MPAGPGGPAPGSPARPGPTGAKWATKVLADVRPVQVAPAFRRFWVGNSLSQLGTQASTFAVMLQVFDVSRSVVLVGTVGMARALPYMLFGLFGGSAADVVDRRKLALLGTGLAALTSVGLTVQGYAHNRQVWLIFALVAARSLASAIGGPAQATFIRRLLPAGLVPAGVVLTMAASQAAALGGPALGGLLASWGGVKLCYLLDTASFAPSLYAMARVPAEEPSEAGAGPRKQGRLVNLAGARSVSEGLRWVRDSAIVRSAFLADLNAMVFGMPVALFPSINAERFGGSPSTLGWLTAAPALGGLVGAVFSGPLGRAVHRGRWILASTVLWGAGVIGFGLSYGLAAALVCLAVAGVADSASVICRTALIQLETPGPVQGRVNAMNTLVGAGGPQLGNFEAGVVASLSSVTVSAVSGGVLTIAGAAALAWLAPELRKHTSRVEPG